MSDVYVVLTTRDTRYGLEVVTEGAYRLESDAEQAAEQLRERGWYETVTVFASSGRGAMIMGVIEGAANVRVRDSFE